MAHCGRYQRADAQIGRFRTGRSDRALQQTESASRSSSQRDEQQSVGWPSATAQARLMVSAQGRPGRFIWAIRRSQRVRRPATGVHEGPSFAGWSARYCSHGEDHGHDSYAVTGLARSYRARAGTHMLDSPNRTLYDAVLRLTSVSNERKSQQFRTSSTKGNMSKAAGGGGGKGGGGGWR